MNNKDTQRKARSAKKNSRIKIKMYKQTKQESQWKLNEKINMCKQKHNAKSRHTI